MASIDEPLRVDRRPIMEQLDNPFLQLPEIRNRIYEYALSANFGLVFFPRSNYVYSQSNSNGLKPLFCEHGQQHNPDNEFNKLKYVCRQICKETSCLEFSVNTITFSGPGVENKSLWSPARAFAEFLQECTPSNVRRLSDVTLVLLADFEKRDLIPGEDPVQFEPSGSFEVIVRFCQRYLQMQVNYFFQDFDLGQRPLVYTMMQGTFFKLALRHEDLREFLPSIVRRSNMMAYAERWASKRCVELLRVPNLQFHPGQLPEDDVLEEYLKDLSRLGLTDDEISRWFNIMKDWRDNEI